MQDEEAVFINNHDLMRQIAALESAIRHMQRRRGWTRALAGGAMLAVLTGVTLWAQSSIGPITLQSLSARIDNLEKRIAKDEASGSKMPSQSGLPAGNPADDATLQQLTAQVAELKQEVAEVRSGQSTVRAPFRIVAAGGQTLLSVTEVTPGAATLEMKGASGKSFTTGISRQGDAFSRWDAATGAAFIGSPAGKHFGVRLFAPGTEDTTVALSQGPNSASIALGANNMERVAMEWENGKARVGVLDNTGQRFLSNLTSHGGSGGDLEISNASGQIVALMDANPVNNEGRAVFTSAGGEPLAKIGAAGPHGDVLLGGPDKSVAVWEMALSGMLR